jgi:hypothetical protein
VRRGRSAYLHLRRDRGRPFNLYPCGFLGCRPDETNPCAQPLSGSRPGCCRDHGAHYTPVFQFFLGYALGVRIAISLMLVAPLGLALGMPFPRGLRLASTQTTSIGAWTWGVNGFFTVIGTVLALILGMVFGFRIVLLLSALCYAGALFVADWQARASTETSLKERVHA